MNRADEQSCMKMGGCSEFRARRPPPDSVCRLERGRNDPFLLHMAQQLTGEISERGQWREIIGIMESVHGNAAPRITVACLGEAPKMESVYAAEHQSPSGAPPLPPWPPPRLLDPRSGGEIRWRRRAAGKRKGSRNGDRRGVFMQGKIAQQGVF